MESLSSCILGTGGAIERVSLCYGVMRWVICWIRVADLQIEYLMISMKHLEPSTPQSTAGEVKQTTGTAHLSLRQTEILNKLQAVTLDHKLEKYQPSCSCVSMGCFICH